MKKEEINRQKCFRQTNRRIDTLSMRVSVRDINKEEREGVITKERERETGLLVVSIDFRGIYTR